MLHGHGFSAIPANAVGVLASTDDDPLAFRESQEVRQTFDIIVESDSELRCVPRTKYTHAVAIYLGAILSDDRTEVVWVNETRPLP